MIARLFSDHVDKVDDWRPTQPLVRKNGHLFTISASRGSSVIGHAGTGEAMRFVRETAIMDEPVVAEALRL